MKDLKYYLSLSYPFTVEIYKEDGEEIYNIEIPDLPGCGADGETFEEAMSRLQEAKELWIEESLKRGLHIPEPVSETDFSGRFLLRIPTKLHMILSKQARGNDLSLNQYVKSILEKEVTLEYERKRIETSDQKILNEIKSLKNEIISLRERINLLEGAKMSVISLTAGSLVTADNIGHYGSTQVLSSSVNVASSHKKSFGPLSLLGEEKAEAA